jgi:hypothetical protein
LDGCGHLHARGHLLLSIGERREFAHIYARRRPIDNAGVGNLCTIVQRSKGWYLVAQKLQQQAPQRRKRRGLTRFDSLSARRYEHRAKAHRNVKKVYAERVHTHTWAHTRGIDKADVGKFVQRGKGRWLVVQILQQEAPQRRKRGRRRELTRFTISSVDL